MVFNFKNRPKKIARIFSIIKDNIFKKLYNIILGRQKISFIIHLIGSLILGEIIFNFFIMAFAITYSGGLITEVVEDYNNYQFFAVTRIFLIIFYFLIVWYNYIMIHKIEPDFLSLKETSFLSRIFKIASTPEQKLNLLESYQIENKYPFIFDSTRINEWDTEKEAFQFFFIIPILAYSLTTTVVLIISKYEDQLLIVLYVILTGILVIICYFSINKFLLKPNKNQRKWKNFWINLSLLVLELTQDPPILYHDTELPKTFTVSDEEYWIKENKLEAPTIKILISNREEKIKSIIIYLVTKDIVSKIVDNVQSSKISYPKNISEFIKHFEDTHNFEAFSEILDQYNLALKFYRVILIVERFPDFGENFFPLLNLEDSSRSAINECTLEVYEKMKKEPSWIFPSSLRSFLSKTPIIAVIGSFFAFYYAEMIMTIVPPLISFLV